MAWHSMVISWIIHIVVVVVLLLIHHWLFIHVLMLRSMLISIEKSWTLMHVHPRILMRITPIHVISIVGSMRIRRMRICTNIS